MLLLDVGLVLIRIIVGSTLAIAGLLKLQVGSYHFLQSVLAYNLIRGRAAQSLAKSLPWLEIVCGLCLLIGFVTPLGTLVGFALLLMFIIAIASAIVYEKHIGCRVFQ